MEVRLCEDQAREKTNIDLVLAREGACEGIFAPGLSRSTPFDLSYQNWSILMLKLIKYRSNRKELC